VYAMAHQSLDGRFRISPVDCRGRAIAPAVLSAAYEISGRALSRAEKVLNDPAVSLSVMERNNSDPGRKSLVASREGSLGKATAAITMGQCLELKESATRERALEIPGPRAYERKWQNQRPRLALAVLLAVLLGTCSALPGKPIEKAIKRKPAITATLQQGPDGESMEDIFTVRERLAMAAGMTIAVMAIICAVRRYRQIRRELKQVSAEADLLQKRVATLRNERNENLGQLASQSGENARLKSENAKLRSERDHWQRAAQEARAQAAAKQYSVEDLRKALGSDAGKEG